MGPHPAVSAEVHGDAGGEQRYADAQRAGDPGQLDAALQDEEVQYAEDQHEHSRFGEERRTAPGGDDGQIDQRGSRTVRILLALRDET